jgi:ATP synthase
MGFGTATLRALIREYLFISLFRACAESLASENASRLAAMERADRNIDELLAKLRNTTRRLRQSSIDEELFDVPPSSCFGRRLTDVGIIRRNKMLGLGLVGTIIVICLVVWIVRRVV